MSMLRKVLARGRLKGARQRLAQDPSPRAYAGLAHEYALLGLTREVHRVCEEGLGLFPGNAQLMRWRDRARRLEREERMIELKHELSEAPRSALWKEMGTLLLESRQYGRAEEVALEWLGATGEEEAHLFLARTRYEAYSRDRSREQGKKAIAALEAAVRAVPNDPRPRRLLLDVLYRIGAWKEARAVAADLLQVEPGMPSLEARFRLLDTKADRSPTVEHALVEVENSGRFVDEAEQSQPRGSGGNVRPVLRRLVEEDDVEAALYLRGSTVLVQGLKGATADRFARAVRTLLSTGRTTGRKLGLGRVYQLQLEGAFGTLGVAPGDMDAGALWCDGDLRAARENALLSLAGMNADTEEVSH